MADAKISALPASTTPLAGTEVVPLVQSGTTKNVSVADLTAGRAVSAASLSLTGSALPTTSGGTGLTSFTSGGLVRATSSSVLAADSNLTYASGVFKMVGNATWATTDIYRIYDVSVTGRIASAWYYLTGDGTTSFSGQIGGADGGGLVFMSGTRTAVGSETVTAMATMTTASLTPATDNTMSLGTGSYRWSVVYAGTGTINTSDARHKQQQRNLTDKELAVAQKVKKLIKAFKFNDAVEEKGTSARTHFGVYAQEVIAAFESENLDAFSYGVICYDEWEDVYKEEIEMRLVDELEIVSVENEDGSVTQKEVATGKKIEKPFITGNKVLVRKAGNAYGVRYDELFAFVIASL